MKVASEQEYHEETCPGCGDKLRFPKQPGTHTIMSNAPAISAKDIEEIFDKKVKEVTESRKKEEPPAPPKEPEVPSYLPKHFCKGKDCDGHANKSRKKVTKRCNNCDQVAPENAGKCAFCGEKDFDELDEDDVVKYNAGLEEGHSHE